MAATSRAIPSRTRRSSASSGRGEASGRSLAPLAKVVDSQTAPRNAVLGRCAYELTPSGRRSRCAMLLSKRIVVTLASFTLLAAACAQPQSQPTPAGGGDAPVRQNRTLTMAVRDEVANLAPKIPGSSGPNITKRLFNATLSLIDGSGAVRPYLAESLPQLNTDTWRVSPDGRMETTYRLRDGLTWQDGTPLTADDFAFAFRAYRDPALGFIGSPEDLMEAVRAPDPRTVVVDWKSLYADAGLLGISGLVPL